MKLTILMLLCLITFSACATDPLIAYEEVISGQAVMIDVRESNEVELGMIKNAKWFSLSQTNQENWIQKFQDLTQGLKLYIYCRSGHRSGLFIEKLHAHHMNAENLGGYNDLKVVLPTNENE